MNNKITTGNQSEPTAFIASIAILRAADANLVGRCRCFTKGGGGWNWDAKRFLEVSEIVGFKSLQCIYLISDYVFVGFKF